MASKTDTMAGTATPQQSSTGEVYDPQVAKARSAWAQLGQSFARITPSQLGRFVLALAGTGALLWLTFSLMSTLIPFEIGVVLAYVTVPLVNWLHKFMPRPLAVALVMLAEFVLLVSFLGLLIPVLVNQIGVAVGELPSQDERRRFFTELVARLQAVMPPEAKAFVQGAVQNAAQDIQQNAAAYATRLVSLVAGAVLGVVGTISFALSLLVLPTWLFAVLRDRNRAVSFVNSVLPRSWQADFWAPLRIADRTLGFYLRGLFIQAFAVAGAAYLGLVILERIGYGPFPYGALLAVLVGFTQLIPAFGPYIGYVLGGLVGLSHSPESGLAVVVMLVAVQILNSKLVASKLQNKVVDLHPAILAVLLVAGSQYGLLGVLLAAPAGVFVRDLYRYINGRFSDPPRPAGLLPGTARKVAAAPAVPGAIESPQAQGKATSRVPVSVGVPYRTETSSPARVQRRV